ATGMLVREGVRAAARRVAGAAAPVLLTVSFAVLTAGLVQTSTSAYAAGRSAAIDAAAVVAPDGTPGLTDAVVAATRGAALLPTTVHAPDGEPLAALGVDPAAFAAARNRLDVRAGTLADLRGAGTAVLTEAVAGRLGRSVGGTLAVTFADGESADLRVVAVVADRAVPAGLLLPRAVVRARDPSALTAAILTAAAPTADGPDALPAGAGARVIDVGTYAAEVDATEDRLVWVFTLLLIGVSAGYGMLAVANILLIAGVQRRGDFRVLRLAGATGRQVAWVAAAEAAIVVAVGAVLGGAVAFVALVSVRTGLSEQVGAPVDLVIPWPTIGGVVAACLVLAVAASVLPTRGRASRSGSGRP
ncbi:MAG TPA: FtsX-like permease family protein, partial [Pilimelia sp.]|nr:FtsX-like permease family protein [Pilimelia sp.]